MEPAPPRRQGPFYNPSLDEVNKEVLAWDLYHMCQGRAMYSLRGVPVRFSSVDEYLDTFEPLLLEECRAQTLRSLYENADREANHLQLRAVEPLEPFRIIQFEAPTEAGSKPLYFDTDLVFVSHEPLDLYADAEADPQGGQSSHLKGQLFHALALINNSSPGTLALKLYLPEEPTSRLPPSQHKRLQMLRKVMVPASGKWYIRKLGNMVTINREFQALYSVRELALVSRLLTPGSSDSAAPAPSLQPPPTLLRAIEATHNPSQLLAIRTCLCGRGVTLIQGPPGTGKTKVILGILSVLLASENARQTTNTARVAVADGGPAWPFDAPRLSAPRAKEAVLRALARSAPWLHADGEIGGGGDAGAMEDSSSAAAPSTEAPKGGAPDADAASTLPPYPFPRAATTDSHVLLGAAMAEVPPKHVLVCAPSNAAIDEIVSRLLGHSGPGMLNAKGEPYLPLVVRVGPNIKESLMDVALDTLAKKRQAEHGDSLTYDAAKMAVLNEAAIVCTTLSCAGYSMFSQLKQGFDTVLIDEAAQAVEVSTLIPLKYACRRLILVGDPNQLPATIFSDHATRHNYEQSLFQRLQIGGQRVAMLTTQYRMHPEISRFPGRRFYDGALKDAPHMADQNAAIWHERRCLAPYVFYDVLDGRATEVSSSWCNEMEAQLAMHIIKFLLETYADAVQPGAIGIISPYNAQVRYIRRLFAEHFEASVASRLEVNSVDGFQGREKDIILLSCVRSDHGMDRQRGIGFVKDARRLNVSITRARSSVFVLGHALTLKSDPLWEATLQDATERGCLLRAHSPIGIWFESVSKETGTGAPASERTEAPAPVKQVGAAAAAVKQDGAAASASPAAARKRARRS